MTEKAEYELIAKVLGEHRHPGSFLACLGEAWLICSCGERIDLPVNDDKVNPVAVAALFEAHQVQHIAEAAADRTGCACEAYTIRTDYGTGVEHDVDQSSCPVHGGADDA